MAYYLADLGQGFTDFCYALCPNVQVHGLVKKPFHCVLGCAAVLLGHATIGDKADKELGAELLRKAHGITGRNLRIQVLIDGGKDSPVHGKHRIAPCAAHIKW